MPRLRLAFAALVASVAAPALADEVVVFAAASLKNALDAVAADYEAATGNTVTISYAGSNLLAKQIIDGAPADIFVSAAETWMDEVEKAGLVVDGTRRDLLGNTLVLVAHGKDAGREIAGPTCPHFWARQAGHGDGRFRARRAIWQGGADLAGPVGQRSRRRSRRPTMSAPR
jgi:ABC-type molybdate transport system substrate-binding protein